MSRINATFQALQQRQQKALSPFITAGDPSLSLTLTLMHALVAGGADVIELGVPFSDPMADGPVIQRASERALAQGVTLREVMGVVSQFRQTNQSTPVVLMGYANPIEAMGVEGFARAAQTAGVDGVLVVDYPPEEAKGLVMLLDKVQIDTIFLLSPTTRESRLREVVQLGRGYLYYVSLNGVTGAANMDLEAVASRVKQIKQFTHLPVGVGFGIRDAASAKRVSAVADAVVIGSRLVQEIQEAGPQAPQRLESLLREIRQAMDENVNKAAS